MAPRRLLLAGCHIALIVAVVLCFTPEGTAQKKPPAGPPQAPVLNMPLPMGAQRGTTLELNLTGANLADPVALWTSIPGAKATIPADNNNGKDNAKLRVSLEVPKETPIGYHSLRLLTMRGVSNLRLFCVDDLPQVIKDGKNTTKAAAQAVPIPCVVAGVMAAESTDYYKVTVQAGQRVSFEVLGRRLGSAFDPQITITDLKTAKEVAFSNDAPGLQTDCRVTHTFKEAGEYLVEVRDAVFKGAADYAYRLRIGDFPCATTPIPMGAKRGSKVSVAFAGPSVEGVQPVEVNVPADPSLDTLWLAPKGPNGLHGWPVALAVSDLDEVVEKEPNDIPAKATRVPVPGAVTGRFQKKDETDHYALTLKKGRYIIEAHTLELYSPTEVYMVLKNDKGADAAKTDPKAVGPARLDFTAPADGEYVLAVQHLLNWGGPAESYRITVTPYEPGFDVALALDRVDIPQTSGAVLNVQAVTRRDYNGPIELSVVGHPGITGSAVIKAGPPPQPNQPVGLLFLSAAPDVAPGVYPVKVQAKATINGKPVVTYANVKAPVGAALGGLPYPPRNLLTGLEVGITEKPPFTLAAKFDQPDAVRGAAATVTITATRSAGFDEEIGIVAVGVPPGVTPALKSIPKGANEVKVTLTPPPQVPYGSYPVSFQGRAKHQNKDFQVTAPPAPLVVAPPFDLKVEPPKVALDVGAKAKFKVTAVRRGGYAGPITLQLQNLPAGVTATAAAIAQGQDAVEVELTAAPNAAVGDKADVKVLGTAPAAANQQNGSPNFTVSVVKK